MSQSRPHLPTSNRGRFRKWIWIGCVVAVLGAFFVLMQPDHTVQMYLAIRGDDFATIKRILDSGYQPDRVINVQSWMKRTAIHIAAESCNSKTIEMLVKAGADVNARDHYGESPLYLSVWCDNTAASQLLLDSGAIVDDKNNGGSTPLENAVRNLNIEHVRLLLSHGANPNSTNGAGRTALHELCRYALRTSVEQDKQLAILLIKFGADISLKDESGVTASEMASERHRGHLVELLGNGSRSHLPVQE